MAGGYNPEKHKRRSLRLRGYDYSGQGAYYMTICTQNRECLFGDIKDNEMALNTAGKMVNDTWNGLKSFFVSASLIDQQMSPTKLLISPVMLERARLTKLSVETSTGTESNSPGTG